MPWSRRIYDLWGSSDPSQNDRRFELTDSFVETDTSRKRKIPVIKRRWKYYRCHFLKRQKADNSGHPTFSKTWYYQRHLQFLDQYSPYKDKVKNNRKHTKELEEFLHFKVKSVEEETDKDSTSVNRGTFADSKQDFNEPFLEINAISEIKEFKTEQNEPDLTDHEMGLGSEPVSEDIPKKMAAVMENRLAERFRLETSNSHQSATHKFFETMADKVAQFPPHLMVEARLKVGQLVNEMQLKKDNEQEILFTSDEMKL